MGNGDMRIVGRGFPLTGQTGAVGAAPTRMPQNAAACVERPKGAEVFRMDKSRAPTDPQKDQRQDQRRRSE